LFRVTTPLCDEASDMKREVLRSAFPQLAEHIEAHELDNDRTAALSDDGLGAALLRELWPLVRHHQNMDDLAERDDFEATMMKQMRVTTILPAMRRALERALEDVPARDAD